MRKPAEPELWECLEICSMPLSDMDKLLMMSDILNKFIPMRRKEVSQWLWNITVILAYIRPNFSSIIQAATYSSISQQLEEMDRFETRWRVQATIEEL